MKQLLFTFLLCCPLFFGCHPSSDQEKKETKEKLSSATIPRFNADSAFAYVKAQTDFGPRVNNTKAHDECAAFMIQTLKTWTPHVVVQPGTVTAYNGTLLSFQNIIASFGPVGNNRILLGAHWDSRPYADHDPDPSRHYTPIDGANDGASGVGVLLEIARQLQLSPPPIGVDIILFDAEDYGPPEELRDSHDNGDHWGLGSQYWAKNPHAPDYFAKYGILLDMVGAADATFFMEGFSMEYAPEIVKKVWDISNQIGYSSYFQYQRGGYITDDHLYVIRYRNIPMIDIIHLDPTTSTGMYRYWHTIEDNVNKINPKTLEVVGQTLLTVIYTEK